MEKKEKKKKKKKKRRRRRNERNKKKKKHERNRRKIVYSIYNTKYSQRYEPSRDLEMALNTAPSVPDIAGCSRSA